MFSTEEAEFDQVWKGMPTNVPCLEAQIMDWSDDVAYSTHDFYDFAVAGLIPVNLLKTEEKVLKDLAGDQKVSAMYAPNVIEDAISQLRQSFTFLPSYFRSTDSRLSSGAVGQYKDWVTGLLARYAGSALSLKAVNGLTLLEIEPVTECEVAILKRLTYHFVIGSPTLALRQLGEGKIIETLFYVILDDAKSSRRLISSDAKQHLDCGVDPVRVSLDLVSALSEAQAVAAFQALSGSNPVSILDANTISST